MGFSAMLAEEYILIVTYRLSAAVRAERINPSNRIFNINCHYFIATVTGLTDHRISAQQKALTVGVIFREQSVI